MIARVSALILFLALPARATFTLTVSTSGPVTPSSVITSTPSGIVCPGTCAAAFVEGSTVTIGVVTPSTVAFVSWGTPCRSNLPSCRLTLTANTVVTAKFSIKLDLSLYGTGLGIITSTGLPAFGNSSGTSVGGTRSYIYPLGTTIVLRQSTGTASSFTGWSGSSGACGTASTCTLTLNGYYHITATFTASASTYPLMVTIPKGGGTVTSSPTGIACPGVCRSTFTANAAVTLTTAAASGYYFGGWANGGCSRGQTCVVHSTSPLQGLGGRYSPAAYFYPISP